MADKVGLDFIVVLAAYPRILFHTCRNSRACIFIIEWKKRDGI